jgi:hypothetical protein
MTHGDDSQVDRHRVDAFASEDELTIQEFLQAAPTTPAPVGCGNSVVAGELRVRGWLRPVL